MQPWLPASQQLHHLHSAVRPPACASCSLHFRLESFAVQLLAQSFLPSVSWTPDVHHNTTCSMPTIPNNSCCCLCNCDFSKEMTLTLCVQSWPTVHLLLHPDQPHSLAALIDAAGAAAAVLHELRGGALPLRCFYPLHLAAAPQGQEQSCPAAIRLQLAVPVMGRAGGGGQKPCPLLAMSV